MKFGEVVFDFGDIFFVVDFLFFVVGDWYVVEVNVLLGCWECEL